MLHSRKLRLLHPPLSLWCQFLQRLCLFPLRWNAIAVLWILFYLLVCIRCLFWAPLKTVPCRRNIVIQIHHCHEDSPVHQKCSVLSLRLRFNHHSHFGLHSLPHFLSHPLSSWMCMIVFCVSISCSIGSCSTSHFTNHCSSSRITYTISSNPLYHLP